MNPLATAKALYAAFNAHNIPGILALLDNNVRWDSYGPDFALAIGSFRGKDGVTDFFGKLVGPTGQQVDMVFMPQFYFVGDGTVHVTGFEAGTLTKYVANGAYTGKQFYNNFDHTIWFAPSGLISDFRANYQLALSGPNWRPWPPKNGAEAETVAAPKAVAKPKTVAKPKAVAKPKSASKPKSAAKSKVAKKSKSPKKKR